MTLIRAQQGAIDGAQTKKLCVPSGSVTTARAPGAPGDDGAAAPPGAPVPWRRLTHAIASTAATAAATPIPIRHRLDNDSDRRGSRLGSRP